MIVGVGLIGTVSATVAAFFVSRRKPKTSEDLTDPSEYTNHDELLARLDALTAQQAEIRVMLEKVTASLKNVDGPSDH